MRVEGSRIQNQKNKRNDRGLSTLKTPLVSVIVPIYNVEPWLRKCLDSLKGQTLKQIEIICIDDGSTDGSGEIAEEYANDEWPVFRVIHHGVNRGLSATRNTGIDAARAEYLMFVDSDDWVEPEFCEIPYRAVINNQADIVIFDALVEGKKKSKKKKDRHNNIKNGLTDEFTAIEHGGWAIWNKLYRKNLFVSIRFPERRIYEDVAITHKLIHCAKRIVYINKLLYHYIQRKGSITHTSRDTDKIDSFMASYEKYVDLVSYGFPKEKLGFYELSMYSAAVGLLSDTISLPGSNRLYAKAKEIVCSTKRIPAGLSIKHRIAVTVFNYDDRLFYFLCRTAGRLKFNSNRNNKC